MRKLFLMLLFIACSQSFAQRLNERGEKVVSTVGVDYYDTPTDQLITHADIYFTYNDSMQLVKVVRDMTVYEGRYKDVLSRDRNGNIKRVCDFKGKWKSDFQYKYETNEHGFILSKTEICDNRVIHIFDYIYDNKRLVQVNKKRRYKDHGEWFDDRDMDHIKFGYIDDNCYWHRMWSATNVYDERIYYNTEMRYDNCSYGDTVNDTNINPNLLIYMNFSGIGLNVEEFELATEWCGLKAKNIVNDGITIRKDNKGNIVELKKISEHSDGSKHLYAKIKLSYLY